MDISYIHYPMLKSVAAELPYIRNKIFFYPYQKFLDFSKKQINNSLFFANSGFTAEAVKAEFKINPTVLYPPVSNDLLFSDALNYSQKRANTVVTIGRIAHDKNLELIPQVAALSSKDISFIIAGLLDSEDTLESLMRLIEKLNLSERVKILPNVERSHLRSLLLGSKIYLHPKINEHFGISIVEAMSSGCIPIVHNSGGAKEFVPRECRYNSVEDAAHKIEKAMDRWSEREANKVSNYAKKFSENEFSKKFIATLNSHKR